MGLKIILDSNVFVESSITAQPIAVTSIASRAAFIDASVCLTEGTYAEVLAKNVERFRKNISDLEKSKLAYENEICGKLKIDTFNAERFKNEFETKFQIFLRKNKTEVIKFPTNLPNHNDLFHMAVEKKLPFDSKGNNFRDAIIAFTVIDVCTANPKSEIFFVTKDKEFLRIMSDLKVDNLVSCDDVKIQEIIESKIDKRQSEKIENRKLELYQFILENKMDELFQYSVTNAKFNVNKILVRGELTSVKEIKGLELEAVENFEVVNETQRSFLATIRLVGELNITVETSQAIKEAGPRTLSQLAGIVQGDPNSLMIGEVKSKQGIGIWEEMHRQTTGYYNLFHEDQTVVVFLRVKCEVETDPATDKIVKANFIAIDQVERARRIPMFPKSVTIKPNE